MLLDFTITYYRRRADQPLRFDIMFRIDSRLNPETLLLKLREGGCCYLKDHGTVITRVFILVNTCNPD